MSTKHKKFTFTPALALTHAVGQSYAGYSDAQWFAVYQWFVQRLYAYKEKHDKSWLYEYVNGTYSTHNGDVDTIFSADELIRRMRYLISSITGFRHPHSAVSGYTGFLGYCGLKKFNDLSKPIIVTIPHDDSFPNRAWFDLRFRSFKKSPNEFHPQATWIMSIGLKLSKDGKTWGLQITYGYKHDSSNWYYYIWQDKKESLGEFVKRCDDEIESLLLPEEKIAQFRAYDERVWQTRRKALDDIFGDSQYLSSIGWDEEIADILLKIDGAGVHGHKIPLTKKRLMVLRRWAESAVKK